MRALVLDFDGLVLDTETAIFVAWERVYQRYGAELPRERWLEAIGTDGRSFEPLAHLQAATGLELREAEIGPLRRRHRDRLIHSMRARPGIEEWVAAARGLGLALAIASSSEHSWVSGHLERLGLLERFDLLMTADDVREVKPSPELFAGALDALGLEPGEALAVEDSPNGVRSAKRAGLYCIAVPGPMTLGLDFCEADLVLESLADRTLAEVIELRRRAPG